MATPKKTGNSSASTAKKKTSTTATKKKTTASATKKTNASTTRKTSSTRKPASSSRRKPVKKSHTGLIIGIISASVVLLAGIITAVVLLSGKEWTKQAFENDVTVNQTTISEVEDEFGKAKESLDYHVVGKNVTIKVWDNVEDDQYVTLIIGSDTGTVYDKELSDAKDMEDAEDFDFDAAFEEEFGYSIDDFEKLTGNSLKGEFFGEGHIKTSSNLWTLSDFKNVRAVKDDGDLDEEELSGGTSYDELVNKFGEPSISYSYRMENSDADGHTILSAIWGNTNGDSIDSFVTIYFVGDGNNDKNYHAVSAEQTGLK